MDTINYSKMSSDAYCRLCGIHAEDLIDIFLKNDSSLDTLFKIRTVLYISITKDDKLSHQICSNCVAKVQEYYLFTKKCKKTQFRLCEENTNSPAVSVWEMEIDDGDAQINCIENIKVENENVIELINDHAEKEKLLDGSEIDNNTNQNFTITSENDSPCSQNCNQTVEASNIAENSAGKIISYSKLAKFLRSKVTVTVKAEKRISPNNSSENTESGSDNRFNSFEMDSLEKAPMNVVAKLRMGEKSDSSFSQSCASDEKFDLDTTRSMSRITLFPSNKISKENSVFKKKLVFLKSKKAESANRKKDKNSVKCPYCGEIFTRDEFEKEHMMLHTDDADLHKIILDHVSPLPTTKQLDCEECKMSFYRELAYIEHMNQHSDLRPVKCHMCDRHFFGHKRTRSHFRSAHLVGTFKCETCSYMAKTLSDLEKHRRGVHLNERIMCNICGKLLSAFAHNMKKHLETHNETRPYKCECCDASFKTSASVARHRENIHFPESVMCSACGTVCKSKQKYKKHFYKCKRRLKKINL